MARWTHEGREDVLEWVEPVALGDIVVAYDIWMDPESGEDVSRCPWLRKLPGTDKYVCRIQDTKPELCRDYPKSRAHAERTECPGFDER